MTGSKEQTLADRPVHGSAHANPAPPDRTALGAAQTRFLEALPRKASELRGAVALVAATPQVERPREELRRRLHALYASAQVFQERALAKALEGACKRIDRARDERRALDEADLRALEDLAARLPALGSSPGRSSRSEPASEQPAAASADRVSLDGRLALVVDDDANVRRRLRGALEAEGMRVQEAAQGQAALASIQRERPQLVLSDILMPQLDGLGLCRALQRDVLLADTPVILVSWKEDLLERMRERRCGARGYLLKDATDAQILHEVRRVLTPRARLEAQLTETGVASGQLEQVGIATLLSLVSARCPRARVSVSDAQHLVEVDLHESVVVGLTHTGADGEFSRGRAALPQLVVVSAGSFEVGQAPSAPRIALRIPVETALRESSGQRPEPSMPEAVVDDDPGLQRISLAIEEVMAETESEPSAAAHRPLDVEQGAFAADHAVLESRDAQAEPVAMSRNSRRWGFALVLSLCVALGYVGYRWLQPTWGMGRPADTVTTQLSPSPSGTASVDEMVGEQSPAATVANVAQDPRAALLASLTYGEILPHIDPTWGVEVQSDQGLLVVEANASAPDTVVHVGGRNLGAPPVQVAVAEGRHELMFQQGDERRFRYLLMRRGETRVVQVP